MTATNASEPVLSIRNLTVDYALRKGHFRAVDDISFDVPRGHTVAIVGESGCGKSTVARSIVRLLTPAAGKILLNGQDITKAAAAFALNCADGLPRPLRFFGPAPHRRGHRGRAPRPARREIRQRTTRRGSQPD